MKKHATRGLLASALFALMSVSNVSYATQDTPTWNADQEYKLTILHTNDNHGRFWPNKYGEYGMAARKTLIDQIRAEVKAQGGDLLLISGGDINTGVPESDLQDAKPDFMGMNLIGYDAMAIGNHEFDNPVEVLRKQEEWADFPFLAANIYSKSSGERMFKPYVIFNKQGIKIALIGLTTEDTAKVGNPEYLDDVEFRDPKEEAKKVIAELRANEKPDLILASTHMGHYSNADYGINAPGDVSLVRYLGDGELDMVIGGHSQEPVCMQEANVTDESFKPGMACKPDLQNGTWIVQAYEWGKYVGRADYTFKNGELELDSYSLIPVNLKKKIKVDGEKKRVFVEEEIAQDPAMVALLQPYQDKGQEQLEVKIGETKVNLVGERNIVRFQQTNLGHLIAAAQMKKVNADFGVMNSGGVRASIEPGDITYKDVLTVQPFSNTVAYIDMSGAEVLDYLNVVATKPVDSGAYAQFYGISMTVEKDKVSDVKIGGEPLDTAKTYRFSVPSYNAAGGDGYPKLTAHKGYVDSRFVDASVLKEFLHNQSPVEAGTFAPKGDIVYK